MSERYQSTRDCPYPPMWCTECGVVVIDLAHHNIFHQKLDSAEANLEMLMDDWRERLTY